MILTAENVHNAAMYCLLNEGETNEPIIVEGVVITAKFHPTRLKEYEPLINEMLLCLSDNFLQSRGGGWSFLNMCEDREGIQWADFHSTMDELVCLGLATKKLSFVLPRDMWCVFAGQMPYIVINDKD